MTTPQHTDSRPIYLASDMHFGAPTRQASRAREEHFLHWLDHIGPKAQALHIVGDLFDFWFEYKRVVPKGYVRLLGRLAHWADHGLAIYLYPGNHDLWYRDYFPKELGIPVLQGIQRYTWFGKRYLVAHGDGLGPGDHGYKALKKVFTNPFAKWLFRNLHPDLGIRLANFSSSTSRAHTGKADDIDYGEREFLYQYANGLEGTPQAADYYVFGHRHMDKVQPLDGGGTLVLLGDWLTRFSYLQVSASGIELKYWPLAGATEPALISGGPSAH